ncbi:PEP-CTERM sorting domain-containing protein [Vibrio sp. TH_r3]|uniref:PEP-CTERM sorting domain-containing protein n=1 Tax=Vibrio sp. TH_r3 TaxID=3082084 RepID=UPI002952B6E6|nr:PEP-CTERM sorting domain-containing protein [Vibrio sp. TH_r3]MDV7104583.1 PEP-CTERM sorting domain-containing protein [Vibrio sp. TH_r3]
MNKYLKSFGAISLVLTATSVNAALIDLSTWTSEGNGTWYLAADNNSVTQTQNGNPTVFINGEDSQGQQLSGQITVETTSDDDFIGFVLGYNAGDLTNSSANYLLIDWKQSNQNYSGTTGEAGLAISQVTGAFSSLADFWGHTGVVTELAEATMLGNTGWGDGVTYDFDLVFTSELVEVYVNDILELSATGTFSNGSFGFYNYSQSDVQYASINQTTAVIPEPSTLAIFSVALLGFAGYRRRFQQKG